MPFKLINRTACRSIARRRYCARVTVALSLTLQGCALRGAPSFEIFGAYFPLWLLSAVVGLVGALVAHRIAVSTGWTQVVPFQLFVCVAVGLTVAVLFWLSGTGQLI